MRWLKKTRRGTGKCFDINRLQRELGVRIGERGRSMLTLACDEMNRTNHRELGAEHLIVGVLEEGGPAAPLLIENGMTLEDTRAQIAEALWDADEPLANMGLTSEASNILATAAEAAGMRGQATIEPEHVTYSFICSGFEITSRVLHMVGVDRQKLLQDSEQLLDNVR